MARRVSSSLRALAAAVPLAFAAAVPAAEAVSYAYVWASEPSADFYRPPNEYASNPGGGTVTITRTGAGAYTVLFVGLNGVGDDSGNVQVTAYGSSGVRCKVLSWIGEAVSVRCFDPAGDPADERFALLFTRADAETTGVAYAWSDEPTENESIANFNYAFNPGGGTVTIQRADTGIYTVNFPGLDVLGLDGGNVQVTAYGADTHYCKVEGWTEDAVDVRCFATDGAPADARFTVLFTKPVAETPDLFYVWANDPDAPAPYEPPTDYSYDASGGTVSVERTGEGAYVVTFPGLDELSVPSSAHVQVTAYGANGRTCKIEGWEIESVAVLCQDAVGNQADTAFSALVVAPEADALGAAMVALGTLRLRLRRTPSMRR